MRQSESNSPQVKIPKWEQSRWYFVGMLLAMILGLLVLFREFVFSDKMLFSGDVVLYGIFYRSMLADFLSGAGPFPLWNPFVSCGLPFVDAIHGATFYPLELIDYLGYLPRMVGFNMLLHFALAGSTAYLAVRQFGLSKGGATVTAVSYAFSPCLLTLSVAGHGGKIYAAALFPLAVFATERLVTEGRWRDVAVLGLAVGMIILTPHLQIAYYIILAVLAFGVFRLLCLMRDGLWRSTTVLRFSKMLAGIVLALAISGVQLLPSARYLLEYSPRADQEQGVEYAASWSLHVEEVVSLVFPDFCGFDQLYGRHGYWGKNNIKDNSEAISVITWLLAALALVLKGNRLKWFWAGLAAATLLYALGTATPFFKLVVTVLPFFEMMRAPSTAMFLFAFALAALAGSAVDGIREAGAKQDHTAERRMRIVILVSLGITLLYAVAMLLFPEGVLRMFAKVSSPQLLAGGIFGAGNWGKALTALPDIRAGAVAAVVMATVAGLFLWKHRDRRIQTMMPIVLGLLILISNLLATSKFVRTIDPLPLFDHNRMTSILSAIDGDERTMLIGANPVVFQLGYHRIANTTGYHGKELRSFAALADAALSNGDVNPRFANLTGTRYFICSDDAVLEPYRFGPRPLDTLLYSSGHYLLENTNCLPRAFLVSRYRVVPDVDSIRHEVLYGSVDLSRVVLLERAPTLGLSEESDSSASVAIISHGVDLVEIDVVTSREQLLVLTDNYYDAWHAEVDGVETTIFRADGSFRAVAVPAGKHRVTFRYSSTQLNWGGRLSLAGLVVALGFIAAGFHRVIRQVQRTSNSTEN